MKNPRVSADVARGGAPASELLVPGALSLVPIASQPAARSDTRSSKQKPHSERRSPIMRYSKALIVAGLWSVMAITNAQSQNGVISEEMDVEAQAAADAQAIASYWTRKKMDDAIPMPTPTVTVDALSLASPPISEESGEPAVPGYARAVILTPATATPHRAHYLLEMHFLPKAVLLAICFNRCMALNPLTPKPAPTVRFSAGGRPIPLPPTPNRPLENYFSPSMAKISFVLLQ